MGIIRFIRKLISSDRNEELKIEHRIVELQKLSNTLGYELKKASPDVDLPTFRVGEVTKAAHNIEPFVPYLSIKVDSMSFLKEKRQKEEEERRRKMHATVEANFDKTKKLIENESVVLAEKALYSNVLLLEKLDSFDLNETFEALRNRIQQLKVVLRERELERIRVEEARRKAAEEAERERQKRIKEEEEQRQREKETAARAYEERILREARVQASRIEELNRIVTQKKENYHAYINYLNVNNVRCFYHFTDINNINSIKRYQGLYSWNYCEKNGINIPSPGGDNSSRSLDMRYSLEDYVRLSFCSDHPMAYNKAKRDGVQLVLLKIKIDVAAFKDTLFSDMNATDNLHHHGGELEDLQKVDISATKANYVSRTDSIFKYHQAECMVKDYLPIEYIVNIDQPEKMYF
jgi:hypothetical protein